MALTRGTLHDVKACIDFITESADTATANTLIGEITTVLGTAHGAAQKQALIEFLLGHINFHTTPLATNAVSFINEATTDIAEVDGIAAYLIAKRNKLISEELFRAATQPSDKLQTLKTDHRAIFDGLFTLATAQEMRDYLVTNRNNLLLDVPVTTIARAIINNNLMFVDTAAEELAKQIAFEYIKSDIAAFDADNIALDAFITNHANANAVRNTYNATAMAMSDGTANDVIGQAVTERISRAINSRDLATLLPDQKTRLNNILIQLVRPGITKPEFIQLINDNRAMLGIANNLAPDHINASQFEGLKNDAMTKHMILGISNQRDIKQTNFLNYANSLAAIYNSTPDEFVRVYNSVKSNFHQGIAALPDLLNAGNREDVIRVAKEAAGNYAVKAVEAMDLNDPRVLTLVTELSLPGTDIDRVRYLLNHTNNRAHMKGLENLNDPTITTTAIHLSIRSAAQTLLVTKRYKEAFEGLLAPSVTGGPDIDTKLAGIEAVLAAYGDGRDLVNQAQAVRVQLHAHTNNLILNLNAVPTSDDLPDAAIPHLVSMMRDSYRKITVNQSTDLINLANNSDAVLQAIERAVDLPAKLAALRDENLITSDERRDILTAEDLITLTKALENRRSQVLAATITNRMNALANSGDAAGLAKIGEIADASSKAALTALLQRHGAVINMGGANVEHLTDADLKKIQKTAAESFDSLLFGVKIFEDIKKLHLREKDISSFLLKFANLSNHSIREHLNSPEAKKAFAKILDGSGNPPRWLGNVDAAHVPDAAIEKIRKQAILQLSLINKAERLIASKESLNRIHTSSRAMADEEKAHRQTRDGQKNVGALILKCEALKAEMEICRSQIKAQDAEGGFTGWKNRLGDSTSDRRTRLEFIENTIRKLDENIQGFNKSQVVETLHYAEESKYVALNRARHEATELLNGVGAAAITSVLTGRPDTDSASKFVNSENAMVSLYTSSIEEKDPNSSWYNRRYAPREVRASTIASVQNNTFIVEAVTGVSLQDWEKAVKTNPASYYDMVIKMALAFTAQSPYKNLSIPAHVPKDMAKLMHTAISMMTNPKVKCRSAYGSHEQFVPDSKEKKIVEAWLKGPHIAVEQRARFEKSVFLSNPDSNVISVPTPKRTM